MTLTKGAVSVFLYEVNHLVDEGHKESIDEVSRHMDNMDVVDWIASKYKDEIDLSLFVGRDRSSGDALNRKLHEFHSVHEGNESRKWGISKNGLCLLVAWCAEMIRDKEGWEIA